MRQHKHRSGVVAGILLPMGLTCLFAFCSLALALMGGRAYKNIQGAVNDGYDTTVAASYLRTKLSQNNIPGTVSLREDESGTQVLVITTEVAGVAYETRIFMAEGTLADGSAETRLVETFGGANQPLNAAGGNRIAALVYCRFSLQEGGLFSAEMESAAGTTVHTAFALTEGGRL